MPDESGTGGVLAVLGMTTDKVVAARRLSVLNALAFAANQAADPDEAALLVMQALGDAVEEIRGGALYRPADDDVATSAAGACGRVRTPVRRRAPRGGGRP